MLEVAVETLLSILDFVVLIAHVVAIPVCFLKGRHGFAWFGLFMLGPGAVFSLRAYRQVRDRLPDDAWRWLFTAQGLAVAALLASIALSATRPESWWDRRNQQQPTVVDRSGPSSNNGRNRASART